MSEFTMKEIDDNLTRLDDLEFMESILPEHYTCEQRENGIHCYSNIGIDENDPEHWDYIMKAIRKKLDTRFMEVFHQTCANHVKFTVYIST